MELYLKFKKKKKKKKVKKGPKKSLSSQTTGIRFLETDTSITLFIADIILNIKVLHLSQAMSVMFVSSGIKVSLIPGGIRGLKGSPVLSVLLTSVVTHYSH